MFTVFAGVLSDILDYVLEPANIIQREATPEPDADDSSRPTVGSCPLSPHCVHLSFSSLSSGCE